MSTVLSKILTAIRGAGSEAGEAIIDSQALRILDQEMRDADNELTTSKEKLAELLAKERLAQKECDQLADQISEYEASAIKALQAENESLATEVAEKVAELEKQLQQQREIESGYSDSAAKLRVNIKKAEQNIKRMRLSVDQVKANDSVQKAQAQVSRGVSGVNSKAKDALESLDRIKKKQALDAAKLEAADEIHDEASGDNLDSKLKAAGISQDDISTESVLERLKKQA